MLREEEKTVEGAKTGKSEEQKAWGRELWCQSPRRRGSKSPGPGVRQTPTHVSALPRSNRGTFSGPLSLGRSSLN